MAKKVVKTVPHAAQRHFADRRYVVGYVPNGGRDNPSPAICLGGRWLEACGFLTGRHVTVSVEPGRIVITPAPST